MRRLHTWQWAAVAIFAAWFNWTVGHRGLFLYDASIVFDGGWRLLQGQIPYRDYFMSHAPGTYFYEALIFRVFGVSYSSMVLAATILNVIGALLAMRICSRLAPGFDFIAGIGTAIWLQPMTGFLQIEQGAFFFDLLGLALLVEAGVAAGCIAQLLRFAGGMALAYAVLCKQNAGGMFVPLCMVFVAMLPFERWKNRMGALAAAAAGGILCACLFVIWLFAKSNPHLFWHYAVQIPSHFASARLRGYDTLSFVLFGATGLALTYPSRLILLAGLFVAGFQLWYARRFTWEMAVGVLTAGLIAVQDLFTRSALNDPQNGAPFIALALCLAAGLMAQLAPSLSLSIPGPPGKSARVSIPAVVWKTAGALMIGEILLYGAYVAWARKVNEFGSGTHFTARLNVPGANRVLWGDPTFADEKKTVRIEREDVEKTVAYLRQRGENFFVFPVSTIYYGLLHRPSVQPWLFFLEGHTFAHEDIPRLDAMTVASFERNQVKIWIHEKSSFLGEHNDLSKFPRTWQWLTSQFHPVETLGIYEILEKNAPATAVVQPKELVRNR